MILTLTPNTGIDYTLVVPRFELNTTIRSVGQAWGMGGKATDAAWVLGKLGAPVMALGFAAGSTGAQMEHMLHARGVSTDFVWVEGETRLNVVLVCADGSGQSTITSSSLQVTQEHLEELQTRYLAALDQASCVVLGGSLPAGAPLELYPWAISQARRGGIPVIFDASGPALRAGVQARPSLIKPNRDELAELLGYRPASPPEIRQAALKLQEDYGTDVIATLGSEGALAVIGEHTYRIPSVAVPISSSAGAGDGVLAGMALALSRGEPPENGLRQGFALAGAILQTPATADFCSEAYQELLSKVTILPFDPDERPGL